MFLVLCGYDTYIVEKQHSDVHMGVHITLTNSTTLRYIFSLFSDALGGFVHTGYSVFPFLCSCPKGPIVSGGNLSLLIPSMHF